MTRELVIPESTGTAKVRNPWLVALFGLITIGIYSIVWYYKINREMRDLGQASGRQAELGTSPATSTWAITAGGLIVVPPLVSLVHTNGRIKAAQRLAGRTDLVNGWIALILYIVFSPAMFAYWQSELNKVWDTISPEGSVAATEYQPAA